MERTQQVVAQSAVILPARDAVRALRILECTLKSVANKKSGYSPDDLLQILDLELRTVCQLVGAVTAQIKVTRAAVQS